MPYSAHISRDNPTCFLFLIDQSASMEDPAGGGEEALAKSEVVADALNGLLTELARKCRRDEGFRDYFQIGVVGYGGSEAALALGGEFAERELVPISELAENPAAVQERLKKEPDGTGGIIEQSVAFPVWVEARAAGGTPMAPALERARSILEGWLAEHPDCFPPVVLNLTDGEANIGGDPLEAARALQMLGSSDGAVLLFNLHVSDTQSPAVMFSADGDGLADSFAQQLFEMSSVLPDELRIVAADQGFVVSESTRGFVFNADIVGVTQFLNVGTQLSLR